MALKSKTSAKSPKEHINHCSEFPLHKNFKLVLEQNVTSQTYLEISYRSQKCLVQLLNQQIYLVN